MTAIYVVVIFLQRVRHGVIQINSKAGFDLPFLYAKSFLLLPFSRFRCDELIDITILGFQIGEW